MYVFSYKVKITYEVEDSHYKSFTSTGLGFAENFSDAAAKLESVYGDELDEILSLVLLEPSEVISLPENVVEDYKNQDFPDLNYCQSC